MILTLYTCKWSCTCSKAVADGPVGQVLAGPFFMNFFAKWQHTSCIISKIFISFLSLLNESEMARKYKQANLLLSAAHAFDWI